MRIQLAERQAVLDKKCCREQTKMFRIVEDHDGFGRPCAWKSLCVEEDDAERDLHREEADDGVAKRLVIQADADRARRLW